MSFQCKHHPRLVLLYKSLSIAGLCRVIHIKESQFSIIDKWGLVY